MSETNQSGMSNEAADIFARGLYFLANVDGMEEREERLIKEFLAESGCATKWEELKDSSFNASEASMMLETTWHRRMFVKAAVALVKADGVYSDAERTAIGQIADAFGMSNAEFGELEQQASRESLE
jgi:tellurite resistance protein